MSYCHLDNVHWKDPCVPPPWWKPTLWSPALKAPAATRFAKNTRHLSAPSPESRPVQPMACDPLTLTYTQQIFVSFEYPPADGFLGHEWRELGIGNFSPQAITIVGEPANGESVDVTAFFTTDEGCALSESRMSSPVETHVAVFCASHSSTQKPTYYGFVTSPIALPTSQVGDCCLPQDIRSLPRWLAWSKHRDWTRRRVPNVLGKPDLAETGSCCSSRPTALPTTMCNGDRTVRRCTLGQYTNWKHLAQGTGVYIQDLPPYSYDGNGSYGVDTWSGEAFPCLINEVTATRRNATRSPTPTR